MILQKSIRGVHSLKMRNLKLINNLKFKNCLLISWMSEKLYLKIILTIFRNASFVLSQSHSSVNFPRHRTAYNVRREINPKETSETLSADLPTCEAEYWERRWTDSSSLLFLSAYEKSFFYGSVDIPSPRRKLFFFFFLKQLLWCTKIFE